MFYQNKNRPQRIKWLRNRVDKLGDGALTDEEFQALIMYQLHEVASIYVNLFTSYAPTVIGTFVMNQVLALIPRFFGVHLNLSEVACVLVPNRQRLLHSLHRSAAQTEHRQLLWRLLLFRRNVASSPE
ncbi:MAG: hypothetical protein MHM6MM_003385 [Cercozoa sp. M6MM]